VRFGDRGWQWIAARHDRGDIARLNKHTGKHERIGDASTPIRNSDARLTTSEPIRRPATRLATPE
jgi:hypothetical protein